jgi:hypothetical protein
MLVSSFQLRYVENVTLEFDTEWCICENGGTKWCK